jgi:uncharacterized surface protein with fasciclin (FAS1) repeats
MSLVPALLAGLLLAGCESQVRQDPLLVRGSANATVYGFAPIYIDRPLAENIANSLIFADYNVLINRAGLNQIFIGPKPYTVFAVTDPGFDQIPDIYRQRLLDPANQAGLRQLMAYTIVPGRYTLANLTDLARRGAGRAGLRTLDGSILTITLQPSGALTLSDPSGRVSQLVLADILQSNGILYAGTTLLAPN